MARTNQAPDPEPLFSLGPDAGPDESYESPRIPPNVVPFNPSPMDGDGPGSSGAQPRPRRTARPATGRRNASGAAVIPSGDDRYVSLAEAAALFGVSPETLRRRISGGSLPAVKGGYNLIRVLLSDVAKLFPPIPTVDPDEYAHW